MNTIFPSSPDGLILCRALGANAPRENPSPRRVPPFVRLLTTFDQQVDGSPLPRPSPCSSSWGTDSAERRPHSRGRRERHPFTPASPDIPFHAAAHCWHRLAHRPGSRASAGRLGTQASRQFTFARASQTKTVTIPAMCHAPSYNPSAPQKECNSTSIPGSAEQGISIIRSAQ